MPVPATVALTRSGMPRGKPLGSATRKAERPSLRPSALMSSRICSALPRHTGAPSTSTSTSTRLSGSDRSTAQPWTWGASVGSTCPTLPQSLAETESVAGTSSPATRGDSAKGASISANCGAGASKRQAPSPPGSAKQVRSTAPLPSSCTGSAPAPVGARSPLNRNDPPTRPSLARHPSQSTPRRACKPTTAGSNARPSGTPTTCNVRANSHGGSESRATRPDGSAATSLIATRESSSINPTEAGTSAAPSSKRSTTLSGSKSKSARARLGRRCLGEAAAARRGRVTGRLRLLMQEVLIHSGGQLRDVA